jgi:hypothetical protein
MTQAKRKRRKRRRWPPNPPRTLSARRYVRVPTQRIALFRFLLEACDNLALFTVADRRTGALLLRYSPDQEREVDEFLAQAAALTGVEPIWTPPRA